jgi:hypothetical protein
MRAEVQFVEDPTVVVVPPPNRGGRYQLEMKPPAQGLPCGHQSPQAILWLIFVEAGQEAEREVSEHICSTCNPERYARVRGWASALR